MPLYMKLYMVIINIYIPIYIYNIFIYIFKFPLIFNLQVPYYSSIEDDIISYNGGYTIRKLSLKLCSVCYGILRSNNLPAKYCFIDENIDNHISIYKKDGYTKII